MGLKEVKKYIAKLGKGATPKTLALSALKAEMGSLVAAEDQSRARGQDEGHRAEEEEIIHLAVNIKRPSSGASSLTSESPYTSNALL